MATGGNPGFHLERSDEGVTLVVTDAWSREAEQALDSGLADGLDLNYAKGFKDIGLEFIREWPLRRVMILARTIKDLSPLYRLSRTLESLSVQMSPTAIVDLAELPTLTSLAADWAQVCGSIDHLPGLRDLFLRSYTEEDLEPLRWNPQLERLRFKDHPQLQSLNGLAAFPGIRHLGIYLATRLSDIDALEGAKPSRLDELHIEACRGLRDLGPVAGAGSLRHLNASDCGDIESVRPLRDLLLLEVLWLYGTTRILDGDLSTLVGLPQLRELRMRSRRMYSPSVERVKGSIAERGS